MNKSLAPCTYFHFITGNLLCTMLDVAEPINVLHSWSALFWFSNKPIIIWAAACGFHIELALHLLLFYWWTDWWDAVIQGRLQHMLICMCVPFVLQCMVWLMHPWIIVLQQTLKLVKKFLTQLCSKELAIRPHYEPTASSPHPYILCKTFLMSSFYQCVGLQSFLVCSYILTKILYALLASLIPPVPVATSCYMITCNT